MKLTKKEIGEGLKLELKKGYNISRISNWADDLYLNLRDDHTLELDNILSHIDIMDAGPEFEYTEKELKILAELLINEDPNPIKKLDDLRFEESD